MSDTGTTPRYWAFISYSHYDRDWARWLHRRLETYRVPRRLAGRPHWAGAVPRRLLPVFRDRDELPSSADLGGVVHRALRDSRYLIVICSRHAARSRWVNEEVEAFKRLGREDRVLCLKIEDSGLDGGVFAPALLQRYGPQGQRLEVQAEPLAADVSAQADGREGAALKLIAGMLGVGYDDLRRRERRRRIQQHLLAAGAAAALVLLGVLGWHWQQDEKRRALDTQALQARIETLYSRGRDELLAHREARAAVLLAEAYRLGVQTPALRYMLGRAMCVVDAQQQRIQTPMPVLLADGDAQARRLMAIGDDSRLRVYARAGGGPQLDIDLGDFTAVYGGFSDKGGLIWIDSEHREAPQRRLRLYAADDGRLLQQFGERHIGDGASLPPVDGDDRRLVYIDETHALNLQTLGGGAQRLPGDFSAARFCRGDRAIIVGRSDGTVELRDPQGLTLRRQFDGLRGRPVALDSTADCGSIAAGSADGAVRVWDGGSGAVLMGGGHGRPITDLQLSIDGTRLMTLTRADMGVWNGRSGVLAYASRFFDPLRNLAAMQAGGRAFARLSEGRLAILDPYSGVERYSLDAHRGGPGTAVFARVGVERDDTAAQQLISGGSDGAIVVWNLPPMPLLDIANHAGADIAPTPMATAASGARMFIADAGGGSLWQFADRQPRLRLDGEPTQAAAFGADARHLALASARSLRLVDGDSGATRWSQALSAPPLLLGFGGEDRYLAAALGGNLVEVYAVQDGTRLLRVDRDEARAQALSPRDDSFAYGRDGAVSLYELKTRQLRWTRRLTTGEDYADGVGVLAFSPDGRRLLATTRRAHAFILDVHSGAVLQRISDPASEYFASGEFSPDGAQVALGDSAKTVLLWRLADHRLRRLGGHSGSVRVTRFSDDGALLLSSGDDGQLKIWDAQRAEPIDSLLAHDGPVMWNNAGFGAQYRYLLSGGADGMARVWDTAPELRDADAITRRLRCRVSWRIEGVALVSRAVDTQDCDEQAPRVSSP